MYAIITVYSSDLYNVQVSLLISLESGSPLEGHFKSYDWPP